MLLTEQMVNGVDVWINTPRRPWEACGTSGMKVLVNGGLNVSELDGWWAEAYTPQLGWALGDGQKHDNDPGWDAAEAEDLYAILENDVIPAFYERNAAGLPSAWLAKIRESMTTLTAQFSANRAVRQYTTDYYLRAAEEFQSRQANQCSLGIQMANWRQDLAQAWPNLCFGEIQVTTNDGYHYFQVEVGLDKIAPEHVRVELYADLPDGGVWREEMVQKEKLPGNSYIYQVQVSADRPVHDFTPRLIPNFPGVAVPLELPLILWHH
jgi:glycogen phosphorylase